MQKCIKHIQKKEKSKNYVIVGIWQFDGKVLYFGNEILSKLEYQNNVEIKLLQNCVALYGRPFDLTSMRGTKIQYLNFYINITTMFLYYQNLSAPVVDLHSRALK